jgi:hypothetical protein
MVITKGWVTAVGLKTHPHLPLDHHLPFEAV